MVEKYLMLNITILYFAVAALFILMGLGHGKLNKLDVKQSAKKPKQTKLKYKLSMVQVDQIKKQNRAGVSMRQLGKLYDVSQATIHNVIHGKYVANDQNTGC